MREVDFSSAEFWEGPGHFPVGSWAGEVPVLEGVGASVLFQTSGSTGAAKWVVLEKAALLVSARAVNAWLGVRNDSVWGKALPSDHVGGFAIFARAFAAGCELKSFSGKWDATRFAAWLGEEQVTHTSLVPTQLHDLVGEAVQSPACLKAVVIGGGRLSEELGQAARDLGWPVLASYGMTEAGSQIATQKLEDLKKPFAEGEMHLLPIWTAEIHEGDLLSLSGDALFSGILSGEGEHTRLEPRRSGSFLTSDRVSLNGDVLRPLGRADSLVKVLGVLVDLEAVERRLRELAGERSRGRDLAVIALPDGRREHVLVAVFEGPVIEAILEEYNQQAGGIEKLEGSFSVPEFPRSSMGKLRRKRLAEMVLGMDRGF